MNSNLDLRDMEYFQDNWGYSSVGGVQLLPEGASSRFLVFGDNGTQPHGSAMWLRAGGHQYLCWELLCVPMPLHLALNQWVLCEPLEGLLLWFLSTQSKSLSFYS